MKQITLLCWAAMAVMSAIMVLVDLTHEEYAWVVFDAGMAFFPVFVEANGWSEERSEKEC